MASFLSNPDYQSYQNTGYQLPVEQILGAINAKTQYFLNSAQRIKNEYDSTFDFNLTNEGNKNRLRATQADIDEKMKGLLKKDLTISDNSANIRKLYKPVMQDQNFIMDEYLTGKINSGFQQAQSDLKKNGADHYNMKSIQVLNETLEDWRNANPSDIQKYTSDTLGTTYQPYDPKIDKDFTKQTQDRVKNGKIKVDIKDGQGNIITQEYSDINSLQAQEYIRSIRPQQQQIQDALDAKLYGNRIRKSSPQEQQQLVSSIEGIQKYNIDKQVAFIEAEKHKVESNYALLPKEEQEKIKSQYQSSIDGYNDGITKAKGMYSTFDASAYFDENKRNISQNQLESLLNQRSVNGIIDGMGLENNSRTIKSDVAFWNNENLNFNKIKLAHEDAYRAEDLRIKAEKALKTKTPSEGGENTNIQPATDVSNIGTAGKSSEEKTQIQGQEIQKNLQGEIEAKKSDVAANLFSQLGVTVNNPDGFGNVDFFSALEKASPNTTLGDLLNSVTGGNETNKTLIKALVNEGSKKLTNGKFYKESTLPTLSLREVKLDIKAALSDPQIFNRAIQKAGLDTGNFNVTDELGYQNAQLAYDERTQEQKYEKEYKETAKQFIPNFQNKTFDQLKHYTEDNYIKDIENELKLKGYTQENIELLRGAIKTGKAIGNILPFSTASGNISTTPFSNERSYKNSTTGELYKYQERWNNYQKTLNEKLSSKSTGASNYNTTTYQITDKTSADDSFNPNVHYNRAAFQTLITNNSSAVDVSGQTQDVDFVQKVKNLINSDANAINGFAPYSDGKNNFITLKINRTADNDKIIKSFDLDPEDLVNTKIYVDNIAIDKLGFKPQSRATSDLQQGRIYGAQTPSGKSFSFYNVGSGNQLNINYDGSLSMISKVGDIFTIKNPTLSTFVKTPIDSRGTTLEPSIISGGADKVAAFVYQTDAEAKRIMDIFQKYNIDFSQEKNISWGELPQKAKEELRNNTISFKNQRD